MTDKLIKLAPASYDVCPERRNHHWLGPDRHRHRVKWTAELLVDLPPGQMPEPFTASEHEFSTLEEACKWFG